MGDNINRTKNTGALSVANKEADIQVTTISGPYVQALAIVYLIASSLAG
jgi:hypothetical protein